MLLQLENVLFQAALESKTLNSIYDSLRVQEIVSTLQTGFPIVGIAPYPDLVLGSNLAVYLSRQTNTDKCFVSPEVFAAEISTSIKNKYAGDFEVFLGEETFINFRPITKFIEEYVVELISCSSTEILNLILTRLRPVIPKYPASTLQANFYNAVLMRGLKWDDNLVLNDIRSETFRRLHFLSNIESDLNCIKSEEYFSEIASSIRDDIHNKNSIAKLKLRNQCFYTKESSLLRIRELKTSIDKFLILYPFYLVESLRQGREEIFYLKLIEIMTEVQDCWGNSYIREWVLRGNDHLHKLIGRDVVWIDGLKVAYLDRFILS